MGIKVKTRSTATSISHKCNVPITRYGRVIQCVVLIEVPEAVVTCSSPSSPAAVVNRRGICPCIVGGIVADINSVPAAIAVLNRKVIEGIPACSKVLVRPPSAYPILINKNVGKRVVGALLDGHAI